MEDDIDIYEDLPSFGNENDGNFTSNKESIDEQPQLKKKIEELTEKVENLQKINESLEKNLFSLLKTAKAEILRKDRMIDELKKQLDDMTFKRRMCHKNGNNTTYKITLRETAVNTNHKLTNGYVPPSQNIVEADVKDSYCSQVKDESNNKCSLIPLTVFGERVAKRIADEQNSENKDNVKRFNNKNNDNNENTEGYTIESDKENGSLTDTNIPTSTEINSLVSTIYKEDKCAKSSLVASKLDTGIDIESNNKSEISSKPEEKSIPNTNCIGKRTRTTDEINRYDSKKRIKLSEEDNVTKKINTEVNTNIENNIHTTEGRYSFKNSDTRHTRTWNRRPIEDNKNDERKDLKHRSCALRDDRDTSRKHRDNNISKRDGYRYNHNGYYRTKSRERDRFDNYHRERSVSSHREERYVRKQHTKYTNHEDKFQKRHNFHNNNVDKLKHFKEEEDSSNIHSMTKGFTSERNSTDWKIIEMKRDYHNNDYELWKVRSKSIDKPNKYKAKSTRDIIECLEHLESTNRTTEKDDIIVEQIESAIKKEDTEVKNKLENYVKNKLENASTELEDGQIFDTLENSPCKTKQDENKASTNKVFIHRETDNHIFSNVIDSTLVRATNNNFPVPKAEDVNSSESKEITEKISDNENIENMENIEKFIHNCASPKKETEEKEIVSSSIICALEEATTRNDIEASVTNVTIDVCNHEVNYETCTTSNTKTESVFPSDQNYHELMKLSLPSEKCENTLTTISEENLIKNDLSSQMMNHTAHSNIESLKKTDKEKSDESYKNNITNNAQNDTRNIENTSPDSMKIEDKCSTNVTETKVQEKQEQDLKQSKTSSGSRNNDKNIKVKSVNASGKIIVLPRRRKPVCLTDTSANMTIHVNNEGEYNNDKNMVSQM